MSFFETWKRKSEIRKRENINRMASDFITLSDSEGRIYISYQGNPLVHVDDDLTARDVMTELLKIRQNFIDSKLNNV